MGRLIIQSQVSAADFDNFFYCERNNCFFDTDTTDTTVNIIFRGKRVTIPTSLSE